jgi:hypothetical protein
VDKLPVIERNSPVRRIFVDVKIEIANNNNNKLTVGSCTLIHVLTDDTKSFGCPKGIHTTYGSTVWIGEGVDVASTVDLNSAQRLEISSYIYLQSTCLR